MGGHFNPDFKIVKHMSYGCNCNMIIGDRPLSQSGAGQPLDALDATCRDYKECQRCVRARFGDRCVGELTSYGWNAITEICTDAGGTCERDTQFAKAHAAEVANYDQNFGHVFAQFQYEEICPNICGKKDFVVHNTEEYNVDDHLNGRYVSHHDLANGRKCYAQGTSNNGLILWEDGEWKMRDDLGTKFYSTDNVPCPHLAQWKHSETGESANIIFGGHGGASLGNGNKVDHQCCTPDLKPFVAYNALTHVCCSNGNIGAFGDIC